MIRFPKSYADLVARLRVPSGFLLVIVFGWFSHPTPRSMAWGVPVAFLGLVLRGWAAGCLAKNQELAVSGPYAYTRNPLYLGTLTVALGLTLCSRSLGLAALFAAVFCFIYLPVIGNEEQHLRKIFPGYSAYADAVPALWPRLSRYSGTENSHPFRASLYLKNQEYQAAAGFAVGIAFLLWRMLG
jgi:protein-S-isoprenylcysteine O-methyltransferase Ste14